MCLHPDASAVQNALKCYLRTRDYCTTPKHIVIMCLAIIKCGVEMGNYVHVNNYVSKAEQTPDVAVRSELRLADTCLHVSSACPTNLLDSSPESCNGPHSPEAKSRRLEPLSVCGRHAGQIAIADYGLH